MIKVKRMKNSEVLKVAGSEYKILIDGKSTDNKFAVIEMNIPPQSGPMPHKHIDILETFYLVEGELEFKYDTETKIIKPGELISIPFNGPVHRFKNISQKNAVLITTVYPSGLEEMFREIAKASTPQEAKLIGEKYGNVFYPESIFE